VLGTEEVAGVHAARRKMQIPHFNQVDFFRGILFVIGRNTPMIPLRAVFADKRNGAVAQSTVRARKPALPSI
jgi:hypothetical protein